MVYFPKFLAKQFNPLFCNTNLLQDTVLRVRGSGCDSALIVTA